jgi:hypothetical protein
MEYISGLKLRTIFLDNGNWWKLFLKHRHLIRISIITNVLKLLVCRTSFLGYHAFVCPQCHKSIKVPHSCKSRFCSSCGKKATDDWIKNRFNTLPDTTWQHITFTMPAAFWCFFWYNRYLFDKIPALAANIIKELSLKKGFIPGVFLALHTFGRDLKRNVHIHLSTTIGGLSLTGDYWVNTAYFFHDSLKKMWKYQIITLLRKEFKENRLKLPPHLQYVKTYSSFVSWTTQFYNQTWNVFLNQPSDNLKQNVNYLGKYIKRPPIGETRIKAYDGKFVTYEYLDHYTNTKKLMTLPVLKFIARLISHIPDKNFRVIRYYGFLANRVSGKLLPLVYALLNLKKVILKKVYTPWRQLIINTFHYDPLNCPFCNIPMLPSYSVFPPPLNFKSWHKEIAHGYFPLL